MKTSTLSVSAAALLPLSELELEELFAQLVSDYIALHGRVGVGTEDTVRQWERVVSGARELTRMYGQRYWLHMNDVSVQFPARTPQGLLAEKYLLANSSGDMRHEIAENLAFFVSRDTDYAITNHFWNGLLAELQLCPHED